MRREVRLEAVAKERGIAIYVTGRIDIALYVKLPEERTPRILALVEAKAARYPVRQGLPQAIDYADTLRVPFAYAANGRHFIEYDSLHRKTSAPKLLKDFPTPEALVERYRATVRARPIMDAPKPPSARAQSATYSASRLHPLEISPTRQDTPSAKYSFEERAEQPVPTSNPPMIIRPTSPSSSTVAHSPALVRQPQNNHAFGTAPPINIAYANSPSPIFSDEPVGIRVVVKRTIAVLALSTLGAMWLLSSVLGNTGNQGAPGRTVTTQTIDVPSVSTNAASVDLAASRVPTLVQLYQAALTAPPIATVCVQCTPVQPTTPTTELAVPLMFTTLPSVPDAMTIMWVSSNGERVNARACASTNCTVVAVFSDGDELQVLGEHEGTAFRGSTNWREVWIDGRSAYIHGTLLTESPP